MSKSKFPKKTAAVVATGVAAVTTLFNTGIPTVSVSRPRSTNPPPAISLTFDFGTNAPPTNAARLFIGHQSGEWVTNGLFTNGGLIGFPYLDNGREPFVMMLQASNHGVLVDSKEVYWNVQDEQLYHFAGNWYLSLMESNGVTVVVNSNGASVTVPGPVIYSNVVQWPANDVEIFSSNGVELVMPKPGALRVHTGGADWILPGDPGQVTAQRRFTGFQAKKDLYRRTLAMSKSLKEAAQKLGVAPSSLWRFRKREAEEAAKIIRLHADEPISQEALYREWRRQRDAAIECQLEYLRALNRVPLEKLDRQPAR